MSTMRGADFLFFDVPIPNLPFEWDIYEDEYHDMIYHYINRERRELDPVKEAARRLALLDEE